MEKNVDYFLGKRKKEKGNFLLTGAVTVDKCVNANTESQCEWANIPKSCDAQIGEQCPFTRGSQ